MEKFRLLISGMLMPRVQCESDSSHEEQILVFDYENYRGNKETRRVLPKRIWFGVTDWHPEPQWILDGFDLDRNALRSFAIDHISSFSANTGVRVSN